LEQPDPKALRESKAQQETMVHKALKVNPEFLERMVLTGRMVLQHS